MEVEYEVDNVDEQENKQDQKNPFRKALKFCKEHKIFTGAALFGVGSWILARAEQRGFEQGQLNAMTIMSAANGHNNYLNK